MAAVLACGPGAVLSHRAAAALWGIRATARSAIDVTAARGNRQRPGITVHRVRRLGEEDCTRHDRIPVTTIPRTLLDLAEVVRPRELERAFEEAERLRLLDVRAVERLLERRPGRRGLKQMRKLLTDSTGPPPATRSELERLFIDVCEDAGLPRPTVNAVIAELEVDVVWTDRRLVVELDGHAFHRTRAAFERDRVRDAALQVAGYRVLRITHRRLVHDPAGVAETVRALLAA